MYGRILVPTEGSTVAEAALDQAITLAARFDAEVHALYVVAYFGFVASWQAALEHETSGTATSSPYPVERSSAAGTGLARPP